jgi:hypothetical protein
MQKKKRYFQFVNYFDVWGNTKEGFDVNNLCTEPFWIVTATDLPTMTQAVKALKKADFLKKTCRANQFTDPYQTGDMLEMEIRKDGRPFGRWFEVTEEEFKAEKGKYSRFCCFRPRR